MGRLPARACASASNNSPTHPSAFGMDDPIPRGFADSSSSYAQQFPLKRNSLPRLVDAQQRRISRICAECIMKSLAAEYPFSFLFGGDFMRLVIRSSPLLLL